MGISFLDPTVKKLKHREVNEQGPSHIVGGSHRRVKLESPGFSEVGQRRSWPQAPGFWYPPEPLQTL